MRGFITESGRWRPGGDQEVVGGSPVLAALRQPREHAPDASWISWSDDAERVTVRFDLDVVDPDSLQALLDRVQSDRRPVTLIYRHGTAWAGESADDGRRCADALDRLFSARGVLTLPPFSAAPRSLDWVDAANDPLLAEGLRLWEGSGGLIGDSVPGFDGLVQRSQLSMPDADGVATFIFVGRWCTSAHIWGETWAADAPGDSAVPDLPFERKANSVYAKVMETDLPECHEVFALIHRADGVPTWVPYRRLVLPCRLKTGAPVFNCLTSFWEPGLAGFTALGMSGRSDPRGRSIPGNHRA